MNLFYNKPKKVINAVKEYYNGKITKFPYSTSEIQQARTWLSSRSSNNSIEIMERLNMIEILLYRKTLN
ncbi:MAG: hypothetical protein AAFN93_06165 [Bacteroidota bacterium]